MNKGKQLVLLGIGILGVVAVATYFLKKKDEQTSSSPFVNAGIPDQIGEDDLTQLENAKMVSEGSQFGVQYYNHVQSALNDSNPSF